MKLDLKASLTLYNQTKGDVLEEWIHDGLERENVSYISYIILLSPYVLFV